MTKATLRAALAWAAVSTPLHLVWEAFHIRFYTIWQDGIAQIAYALAHCTAGDAVIAFTTFVVAAVGARDPNWPWRVPRLGVPLLLAAGLGYTVVSEWINVYWLGRWAYLERMPMVGGIGLTPLAQWLVVPLVSLALYRRFALSGRALPTN